MAHVSDEFEVVWDGAHHGRGEDLFRKPAYQKEKTPFLPETHGERHRSSESGKISATMDVMTHEWQKVQRIANLTNTGREAARRVLMILEERGLIESSVEDAVGYARLYRLKRG